MNQNFFPGMDLKPSKAHAFKAQKAPKSPKAAKSKKKKFGNISTRALKHCNPFPWKRPALSAPLQPVSDPFFDSLNREQKLVAFHQDGPCLVTAGPGTGKTHSMTARAHALALAGVNPARILMMTFTRKAAGEITERLARVNPDYAAIRAGTFHSIAIDIVRRYSEIENVTIIDPDEEKNEYLAFLYVWFGLEDGIKGRAKDWEEMSKIFWRIESTQKPASRELDIYAILDDDKTFNEIRSLLDISDWDRFSGEDIFNSFADYVKDLLPESFRGDGVEWLFGLLTDISKNFREHKENHGLFSFDDCITYATKILNGKWGDQIRSCIDFVSVDEYQDSDTEQIAFVESLCRHNGNIMAIGDPKQSIYCWRGAFPQVFEAFRERWQPREIGLVQNYRSNDEVIDFVNAVTMTGHRSKETIVATRGEGGISSHRRCRATVEPDDISALLLKKVKEYGPENVAVLLRSLRYTPDGAPVSGVLQSLLVEHNIPFRLVGGLKVTERVAFKRFRDVVRIVMEPSWALPWIALVKLMPGIGEVGATRFAARLAGVPDIISAKNLLYEMEHENSAFAEAARRLNIMFKDFHDGMTVPEIMDACLGWIMLISKNLAKNAFEKDIFDYPQIDWHNLKEVRDDTKKRVFSSDDGAVIDFIERIATRHKKPNTWLDAVNFDEGPEDSQKAVTISTIHGSKGKEWPVVIIGGLNEGSFPSRQVLAKAEGLNKSVFDIWEGVEEHNLLFVACSRAKNELYMVSGEVESPFISNALNVLDVSDEVDIPGIATGKHGKRRLMPVKLSSLYTRH